MYYLNLCTLHLTLYEPTVVKFTNKIGKYFSVEENPLRTPYHCENETIINSRSLLSPVGALSSLATINYAHKLGAGNRKP